VTNFHAALMGDWVLAQLNVAQIEAARESIRDQVFRDDDLEMRRYNTRQRLDFTTVSPLDKSESLFFERETDLIECTRKYGLSREESGGFMSGVYYLRQMTSPVMLTLGKVWGWRGIDLVELDLPWGALPLKQKFDELRFGEIHKDLDGSLSAGNFHVEPMIGKISASDIKARMESAGLADMQNWYFTDEYIFAISAGQFRTIYRANTDEIGATNEWFGPSEACIDMLDSFV